MGVDTSEDNFDWSAYLDKHKTVVTEVTPSGTGVEGIDIGKILADENKLKDYVNGKLELPSPDEGNKIITNWVGHSATDGLFDPNLIGTPTKKEEDK